MMCCPDEVLLLEINVTGNGACWFEEGLTGSDFRGLEAGNGDWS